MIISYADDYYFRLSPSVLIKNGKFKWLNKYKRYAVWGEVDFKKQIIKLGKFEPILFNEKYISIFGDSWSTQIGRGQLKVKKTIKGKIHATWMHGHDEYGNKWIDFYDKIGHTKIPIRPGAFCGDKKYYKEDDKTWSEILVVGEKND